MFSTSFLPCCTLTWPLKDITDSHESSLSLCISHPDVSCGNQGSCLVCPSCSTWSPTCFRGGGTHSWSAWQYVVMVALHTDLFRMTTPGVTMLELAPGSQHSSYQTHFLCLRREGSSKRSLGASRVLWSREWSLLSAPMAMQWGGGSAGPRGRRHLLGGHYARARHGD